MEMTNIENQETCQSSISQSRMYQKPVQQLNMHSIQEVKEELECFAQQFERAKALKKTFMNWSQDQVRAFERWKMYHDEQIPGTEEIEGKGRASMMLMRDAELQLHYVNLKVAPLINQEKFTAELVKEKETNRLLLLENQRMIASYLQEKNMYQHQLTAFRQQVDSLQQRIHTGVMEHKPVWQYSGDLQGQQRHIHGNVFCQPMKTNKGYELQTLGKDVRLQAESFQQQLEKEKVNHQEMLKNAWCTINRERAEKEALQKRLSEMEIIFATQQRTQQNVQVPNQDLSSHKKKNHVSPMRNAKRKRCDYEDPNTEDEFKVKRLCKLKVSRFDVDHPGNQEEAGNADRNPPTPQTPSTRSIKTPAARSKFRRNLEAIRRKSMKRLIPQSLGRATKTPERRLLKADC